jgi:uncharacterized protein YdiU (UPF0061 family)
MDAYSPGTVFSSIDQRGRYAYGNQPGIGQWNLARLAEALLPLLHADEPKAIELAQEALAAYPVAYTKAWLGGMRQKLGLVGDQDPTAAPAASDEEDGGLAEAFLSLLEAQQVDFTNAFRSLSSALRGDTDKARALYRDPSAFDAWSRSWHARLTAGGLVLTDDAEMAARAAHMDRVNPLYIARNHKVEEALAAGVRGDLGPTEQLLAVLAQPFDERPGLEAYAVPAPPAFTEIYQTFCGT